MGARKGRIAGYDDVDGNPAQQLTGLLTRANLPKAPPKSVIRSREQCFDCFAKAHRESV